MAGLVPAIHVLNGCKDVDARNKCGHDRKGSDDLFLQMLGDLEQVLVAAA